MKIRTENTGGGCMIDYIDLYNNYAIGVNDECIALIDYNLQYDEIDVSYIYEYGIEFEFGSEPRGNGYYIKAVFETTDDQKHYYSIILLFNGVCFTIDNGLITIYPNMNDLLSNENQIEKINLPKQA